MSRLFSLVACAVIGFGSALLAQEGVKPADKPADSKPAVAKPTDAKAGDAKAPTTPVAKDASPLGVRQSHVNSLLKELKQKFEDLQKSKAIEPAQAERLKKALVETQSTRLEERMSELVKLLDASTFSTASDEHKKVIADIRKLIAILTEDEDERKKEEKDLLKFKEDIKKLIAEEKKLDKESEKVGEKDRTLADLAAQIRALEDLIKREQKIAEDAAKKRGDGLQPLARVADEQNKVRTDTERLAKAIGGQDPGGAPKGEAKPSEGKPGEGKPGEGKPGEGKPGEGKPGEGKPGEGKPGEGKPGEGKPGEGKPGEGKPGEGKPGEGKPGEGKPGEGKPGEGGESSGEKQQGPGDNPGEKPLHKAMEEQKKAEANLGKGKSRDGEQNAKSAVAEMKKALDELKKEKDRIASLPPEAFEKMAQNQDKTADKTSDLEKKMAEAKKSGGGQGGEGGAGGEGGEPKETPGQQNVQQAQKNMQDASGKLRKQYPKQASKKQKEAVKDLEAALKEIEKRLAQLRQEMQAEKLAALEAHFRAMLELQKPLTIGTKDYDRRKAQRPWSRPELLEVGKISVKERELSVMAQQALDMLTEDGTSVIFPLVVEQLRDDLVSSSDLIKSQQTGSYTQGLQREIENTLKELIDALEQAQRQNDSPPPPPGDPPTGPQDEPPLLPTSAELKLLRASQLRVNRRTKSFDDVRPEGTLEGVMQEEVVKIGKQQQQVAEMTRAMIERN